MKVLVGIDGSAGALEAARQAGQLLSAPADTIGLYYSPPTITVRSSAPAAAGSEVLDHARRALSSAVFQQATAELPLALRGTVHEIVGTQDPRQGILSAVEDWRADLIVVGASGLGPLRRLMVGSVSGTVARTAHVPVLLVRSLQERQQR